jgi:hypothetical protein
VVHQSILLPLDYGFPHVDGVLLLVDDNKGHAELFLQITLSRGNGDSEESFDRQKWAKWINALLLLLSQSTSVFDMSMKVLLYNCQSMASLHLILYTQGFWLSCDCKKVLNVILNGSLALNPSE